MIFYILSFFISLITLIGFGLLISNILIKYKFVSNINFGENGLIGTFFLLLLSILIHFFFPISNFITISIGIIGIFCFIVLGKSKIDFSNFFIIALLIIFTIPVLISIKGHPDFDWYHLPYINYLKDSKIIFGIGNVNDFFGYTHTWNDFAAIMRLPFFESKNSTQLPGIFVMFCFIALIQYLIKYKSYKFIYIFISLFLILFLLIYDRVDQFGSHGPSNVLTILILCNVLFLVLGLEKEKDDIIFKILVFSSLVFLIRATAIIFLPIIVFILIRYYSNVHQLLFKKKLYIFVIFLMIIFFTKNIITSGCFLYPASFTCFSNQTLSWSIGSETTEKRFDFMNATSRGWKNYILEKSENNSVHDYNELVEKEYALDPASYNTSGIMFWFKYWLQSSEREKILKDFLYPFLFFLILFLLSKKKFTTSSVITSGRIHEVLLVFFFNIVIWFWLSKSTLYGGDVALGAFAVLLCSILIDKLVFNFEKLKKIILILIFLSFISFEFNNLNRIYKEYFIDNSNSIYFPWIKINNYENNYKIVTINNYNLNVKLNDPNKPLGSPTHCGNIDMICIPEDRLSCINSIKKIAGYLIIDSDGLACTKMLIKRYWY